VYVCECLFVHKCLCIFRCVFICDYIFVCVCVYMDIWKKIKLYICVSLFSVYAYVHMHVCKCYVYICAHVCMHMCICKIMYVVFLCVHWLIVVHRTKEMKIIYFCLSHFPLLSRTQSSLFLFPLTRCQSSHTSCPRPSPLSMPRSSSFFSISKGLMCDSISNLTHYFFS